jgi:hypothetical protein
MYIKSTLKDNQMPNVIEVSERLNGQLLSTSVIETALNYEDIESTVRLYKMDKDAEIIYLGAEVFSPTDEKIEAAYVGLSLDKGTELARHILKLVNEIESHI